MESKHGKTNLETKRIDAEGYVAIWNKMEMIEGSIDLTEYRLNEIIDELLPKYKGMCGHMKADLFSKVTSVEAQLVYVIELLDKITVAL